MELAGRFGLLVYGYDRTLCADAPRRPLDVVNDNFVGPTFTYFENLVPVGGMR